MTSHVFLRHRLEPISREGDPGRGLAATVQDPLWLLARQLQFGELTGEDAGSPVQAEARLTSAAITGWRPTPDAAVLPIDPATDVFDATITGERAAGDLTTRDRLDAGRRLVSIIDASARATLIGRFALTVPDGSTLAAAAERFPDGIAAALAMAPVVADAAALAAALGLPLPAVTDVIGDLADFVTWTMTTFGLGPDVWVPSLIERQFDLIANGAGIALRAEQHVRAGLDWFDLDATPAVGDNEGTQSTVVRRIPSTIRFPGMPADRFWEFEDAELALHAMDAGTTDLARMALVEFSTVYGNDWFTFPVPARFGSLSAIEQLVVTDSFGRTQLITPGVTDGSPWAMHAPSHGQDGAVPWLVTPAVGVGALKGPVVEQVAFARDEMANLVWAVERLVTSDDGYIIDLVAEYADRHRDATASPVDAELLYRLMTDVPEHWVPFVPVQLPGGRRQVGLVEAVLPRPSTVGEPTVVEPRTSTLAELRHLVIDEREVPPSGVVISREWWLARAANGRRVVWAARTAGVGRGEGASGLAFDVAEDVRGER